MQISILESAMREAMQEAELATKVGNAPFGCIVIDQEGKVILKEHDRVREYMDPTAHGEINAIRILCQKLRTLSLSEYVFVTSSEPCPSCMAGMIKARVEKVYYGAKTEPSASLPIPAEAIAEQSQKYPIKVIGGILTDECLAQRNQLRLTL